MSPRINLSTRNLAMRLAVLATLCGTRSADSQNLKPYLQIHMIDVGQGDSTLIECPNGNRILVDAGSVSGLTNSEKEIIEEYIQARLPNQRLQTLVVTHPDRDHYNLLRQVLRTIQVDRVFFGGELGNYSQPALRPFRGFLKEFEPDRLESPTGHDPEGTPNAQIDCGEADVWILAANVPEPSPQSNFVNNTPSIVLRVAYDSFEAILTGDATTTTEGAIESAYSGAFLESDLLKLGHHGSRATSTGPTWTTTVGPKVAIASASDTNPFGHPALDVIERVDDHTLTVSPHLLRSCDGPGNCSEVSTTEALYSTASSGTLVITTDGDDWRIDCHAPNGC